MGKTLAELAMAGFAALGIFGSPYAGNQVSYAQEVQSERQRVPVPPEGAIKIAEKEIREIYLTEYRTSDPAKKKAFGEKLLANGREAADKAQKYVLLRDAANTLADLLELDSAFEAVKELGNTFEGYPTLNEYYKYLTTAQKRARTKDEATKVANAYLQLADLAVQEKNYSFATKTAKTAETVGKKTGDTFLVERASNLVKAIPDMEREYGLYKKAEDLLQVNPNDPDANTIVGKYKGFVEGDWEKALLHLSRGTNGISQAADQEIMLRSSNMDNPDAVCLVADLWYNLSNKAKNALDKNRFAAHSRELFKYALENGATGFKRDMAEKRIGELEKKVNPTARGPPGTGGWIDLMKMIDPTKDSVNGKWEIRNGSWVSDNSNQARLEIPYQPPEEYDFRITFTRTKGNDVVAQILSKNGRQFMWGAGWGQDKYLSFELIDGKGAGFNKTTIERNGYLKNGKMHTSLVEVRKGGVKAYLDGKLMAEYKTNYDDLSLVSTWQLRDSNSLGIGSYASPTIFHKIELCEVTGKGKRLR